LLLEFRCRLGIKAAILPRKKQKLRLSEYAREKLYPEPGKPMAGGTRGEKTLTPRVKISGKEGEMKKIVESDGLAYLEFEVGDILRRRTPREVVISAGRDDYDLRVVAILEREFDGRASIALAVGERWVTDDRGPGPFYHSIHQKGQFRVIADCPGGYSVLFER